MKNEKWRRILEARKVLLGKQQVPWITNENGYADSKVWELKVTTFLRSMLLFRSKQ